MSEEPAPREVITDGTHVQEALQLLQKEIGSSEAVQSILKRAEQIISQSVNPIAGPQEIPCDGLLYGLIQSGKTSIITITAAMAADNGFRCILILTSDINILYNQTLKRVRAALPGLNVLAKNDPKDPARFSRQLRTSQFVIVCSKNGGTLGSLLDAFKLAKSKGLPAMIIDDEADQASLNTFTRKATGQVSTINGVITQLRNYFQVNSYIQVTATPQALILQKPSHKYHPSFTVLSEPGKGYMGGDEFFGPTSTVLKDNIDIHEIDLLRVGKHPTPSGKVPSGLRRALFVFLVAATERKLKGSMEGSAFLCHVSVNKKDHEYIVSLIDRFKHEVITTMNTPSSQSALKLIEEIKDAYADLVQTEPNLSPFDEILKKIIFYMPSAIIRFVNSESNEEIQLDSAFNIFVGGNKLSRGVTIENLLVSYYGRYPKKPNSDTVLQHARMYGYRENNIRLTRLFLPQELAQRYKYIHQMENALRDLIQKDPKGKFTGIYIKSPLRATRPSVLDTDSIGMYVAGSMYNPCFPLRTKEMAEVTKRIDERLRHIPDHAEAQKMDVKFIIKMIEQCRPDEKYGTHLWNVVALKAAIHVIESLQGSDAYVVVRRKRELNAIRRETQGIHASEEEKLAPPNTLTLFMYRQNEQSNGEVAVWWPMLRIPDGNYVIAFSFDD